MVEYPEEYLIPDAIISDKFLTTKNIYKCLPNFTFFSCSVGFLDCVALVARVALYQTDSIRNTSWLFLLDIMDACKLIVSGYFSVITVNLATTVSFIL